MNSITIKVDANIYSVDAVLNTAYWCADKCVVEPKVVEKEISILINARTPFDLTQEFMDLFLIMLTHNEIRSRLRSQFGTLENAIIQKAFFPVVNP